MENKLVNLEALETDDEFRVAYLFYLQQANTYIASIFWHVFNDGTRKKKLYEVIKPCDEKIKQNHTRNRQLHEVLDAKLLKSIVPQESGAKEPFMDCYNAGFVTLLLALPDNMKLSFKNKLSTEHAIPLTLEAFCDAIDALRLKRNFLKAWELKKNKSNPPDDGETLRALGLLLPSKLHQNFCGAVSHAIARISRKTGRRPGVNVADVRAVFSAARKDRAEATMAQFSQLRTKKIMTANERKAKEHSKQAWMNKYQQLYPDGAWPRYKYHNFKILYYFFGDANVARITTMLDALAERKGHKLPAGVHFSRDVEVIYNVGMQINNVLDLAFWRLSKADADQQVLLIADGYSKRQAKDEMERHSPLQGRMREIRNAIAHNGLFWCVDIANRHLSVEDIFNQVFTAFLNPHIQNPREQINNIYSKIQGIINKQDYDWVFPQNPDQNNMEPDQTPPKVIRHWSKPNRQEYANPVKWRIDRRIKVRAVMSEWMKAIKAARDQTLRASKKQKLFSTGTKADF